MRRRYHALLKAAALTAGLAFGAVGIAGAAADDNGRARVAFFGFQLINTSLEPTTAAEERRIRDSTSSSGKSWTPPAASRSSRSRPTCRRTRRGAAARHCNGCARDFARRIDADRAAWGTVQKVSNLILNINVYMEDVQTGKLEFIRSVDIRGNDKSWRRGLDYLLRHYLFGEP